MHTIPPFFRPSLIALLIGDRAKGHGHVVAQHSTAIASDPSRLLRPTCVVRLLVNPVVAGVASLTIASLLRDLLRDRR